ncbi:MAG: O-antigen ligase family protein, partial [Clostridia bacterium]|nr:O-antigen ligase family protein [Clostridia bacterium]
MDKNENLTETKKVKADAGLRLFMFLSKADTQLISMIIMLMLSAQVLFGVFEKTASQPDLFALYYGKALVIRLLGYLGLANWVIDFYCRVFIHREKAVKWTFLKRPWTGFFAALLFWSMFSILAATDINLAVFGGAYRYEGFASYLAYAGIFACASLIRTDKYRKTVFGSVAVCSSLLAIFALLKDLAQWTFLMNRSGSVNAFSGTFINSNHYGYYICVSICVTAGLYMMVEKWWSKLLCGAGFALNTVVLLYNRSLGPYIAATAGLIILAVFILIRRGIKKTLPLLILVAVFAGLSFAVNGHKVLNDLGAFAKEAGEVVSNIGSGETDTQEGQHAIDYIGNYRGALWKTTFDVMLKHPVIGVGADNVQLYIGNAIPHNEYLQVGANLGFVGLALYLASLVSCFAFSIKNLIKMSDGALVAGVATIVYCASAFVGISIPVATYQLFFFMGLLTGWFKDRDDAAMNTLAIEELEKKQEK